MDGQIGRTLHSLCVPYQRDICSNDYEILLVDNGSPQPLPSERWAVADNVHYDYIPPEQRGHVCAAINRAAAKARGSTVCIMIDGARMLSPGVLSWGWRLAQMRPRAFVEVRGWHLGPKLQMESVQEGYNSDVERQLLDQIVWQENGYRLFEISVPAKSTRGGFAAKATETTCAFMNRSLFLELGGYDERFSTPGGGLANVDFFWRATAAADVVFALLGEGTFHQIHGGAATGLAPEAKRETFRGWRREYEAPEPSIQQRPSSLHACPCRSSPAGVQEMVVRERRNRWNLSATQAGRIGWRGLIVAGAMGLLFRVALAACSTGTNDTAAWERFGNEIAGDGLFATYINDPRFNHPPLAGYWAFVATQLARHTGLSFSFAFKLPVIVADCGSAFLLYVIWRRAGPAHAAAAFAVYAFNLDAILVSGYHCNTDPIYAFACLLSVWLIEDRRSDFWGGAALAAAINVKLIPILLVAPLGALPRPRGA